VDRWNQAPGNQQIRALVLYRWPNFDRWHIEGKGGVQAGFRAVIERGYRWREDATPPPPPPPQWRPGSSLATATTTRLRRSPGHAGKPPEDVVATLEAGAEVTLLAGGPKPVDGLHWWPVRRNEPGLDPLAAVGWMAQTAPDGTALLALAAEAPAFAAGEGVFNASTGHLNLRAAASRAAAILDKLAPGATATVLAGPQAAEDLTWWQARYVDSAGVAHEGWLADRAPDGEVLLAAEAYRGVA
jgi:hypothetical protein